MHPVNFIFKVKRTSCCAYAGVCVSHSADLGSQEKAGTAPVTMDSYFESTLFGLERLVIANLARDSLLDILAHAFV